MHKEICNSSDPKVIGVDNGIFQVEIEDFYLENRVDYNLIEKLFLLPQIKSFPKHNQEVFNFRMMGLVAKLLKNAIVTDIMGFSPYFFSCQYLVSENFIQCLKDHGVNRNEYKTFPIKLENEKDTFHLLFIPIIENKEVNFEKSLIFSEHDFGNTTKSYYDVKSLNEYQILTDKTTMSSFERIVLSAKHSNKDIISIQGTSNLFFSDSLIEKMISNNMTSFLIPERQIELLFD